MSHCYWGQSFPPPLANWLALGGEPEKSGDPPLLPNYVGGYFTSKHAYNV